MQYGTNTNVNSLGSKHSFAYHIYMGVVTMNIEVDFNIDTIFREWVYVKNSKECGCGFDTMLPIVPVNKMPDSGWRMCVTCGGRLTDSLVSEYNRYNGYSGYDE